MSLRSCPNTETLHQLCEGVLSADSETEITAHLDQCAACRESLDAIGRPIASPLPLSELTPASDPSKKLQVALQQLKSASLADAIGPSRVVFQDLCPWFDPIDNGIGRIAEYELLECVGRGGMGVVFKARDTRLERCVAVKLMSPAMLGDGTARQRFLREARAAAGINHPSVVTLYSVAEVRELPYLVMEYVAGESLQQRLNQVGRLPIESIIAISRQTAEGLAAAHAQGVVHRDIKPATIVLTTGTDQVKLTDFGLALRIDGSTLTHSGLLLGTPEFVAPEQIDSAFGDIDHRTDLFSLGSVLYLMCSGKAPFFGTSILSTLSHICTNQTEAIERINPNVPTWLTELIGKLHAKEPSQRIASAQDVVKILTQHTMHRGLPTTGPDKPIATPVLSSRSPVLTAPANQPRSRRLLILIGSLLLGGFLFALMLSRWRGGDPFDVFARNSEELLEFLDTDSDCRITLTSNGPYDLPAIEFVERQISIIAAEGVKPLLQFEVDQGTPAISVFDGSLHLAGLVIEADVSADDSQHEDDLDDEIEDFSLVSCEDGELSAIDCKFLSGGGGACIHLESVNCNLTHCEFHAGETAVISWRTGQSSTLKLSGCVLTGGTIVEVQELTDAELILSQCTLFGHVTIRIEAGEEMEGRLDVDARKCLFDANNALLLVEEIDPKEEFALEEIFRWNGKSNLLPHRLLAAWDEDENEKVEVTDLTAWRTLARATESGSEQGIPQYRHPRERLWLRLSAGELQSGDLQLQDTTNKHNVGADSSNVGPRFRK